MNIKKYLSDVIIGIPKNALINLDVHIILINNGDLKELSPDEFQIFLSLLQGFLVHLSCFEVVESIYRFIFKSIFYLFKWSHFLLAIEPHSSKPSVMLLILIWKHKVGSWAVTNRRWLSLALWVLYCSINFQSILKRVCMQLITRHMLQINLCAVV